MRARFARALAAASLTVTVLACGDDTGVSPLAPARGLAGMWVRYVPPAPPGLPVARPRPIDDTLFVASDLSGHWSREIEGSAGIVPLRSTETVHVEEHGPVLRMVIVLPICRACEGLLGVQLTTFATPPTFRIERMDADHLVIRQIDPAGMPVAIPYGPAYYVRTKSQSMLD